MHAGEATGPARPRTPAPWAPAEVSGRGPAAPRLAQPDTGLADGMNEEAGVLPAGARMGANPGQRAALVAGEGACRPGHFSAHAGHESAANLVTSTLLAAYMR